MSLEASNEALTPQIRMTSQQFRTTMTHQGFTGNRESEAEVYKYWIDDYKTRKGRSPTLLEVGCGLGDMAEHLSKMVGEDHYHGIDSNPSFVLEARERLPDLRFSLQNFFTLPVDTQQYDIVCIPYTLITLFSFDRQEILLRKALAHGQMVMVHTMLPEIYGEQGDIVKQLKKEEFGTDFEPEAYFRCEASLRAILDALKCSKIQRHDHDVRTSRGVYTYTVMMYRR